MSKVKSNKWPYHNGDFSGPDPHKSYLKGDEGGGTKVVAIGDKLFNTQIQ